jgi:hypothetical protein
MSIHSIRLAGPWEWRSFSGTAEKSDISEFVKCQLPFPDASCAPPGSIVMRRRFHRPTGLDDRTTVRVALQFRGNKSAHSAQAMESCLQVRVNDQGVPATVVESPENSDSNGEIRLQLRCDISPLLRPFNDLQIDFNHPEHQLSLEAACLEIKNNG